MQLSDCKAGMKVYFGRSHGEQTLGEIVKVNPAKCKVKQLESRGTMKAYPVGSIWTVPPSLMTPAPAGTSAAPVAPAAKRPEAEIMRDILGCYAGLSPENLTCDGELPRAQVERRRAELSRKLRALFTEIGREVSESEAYGVADSLPRESFSDHLAKLAAERQAKAAREAALAGPSAVALGLPADVVGKSIRLGRSVFTITGIKMANRQYPVMATNQNGKGYKLSVDQVKQGLGLATAPAPVPAASVPATLPANVVGKTFTCRGKTYEVVSINHRNWKFPVIAARKPDGKRFKFPAAVVKAGLVA